MKQTNLMLTAGALILILAVVVYGLGNALIPLLGSLILAYLLFPVVRRLENIGIKRNYAVVGVFVTAALIISFTITLILPGVVSDTEKMVRELPQTIDRALGKIEHLSTRVGLDLNLDQESLIAIVKEHSTNFSADTVKTVTILFKKALSNLFGILLILLNLFMFPLFFFYVINDYEQISAEISSFVPNKLKPELKLFAAKINSILSGYFRGQLMVGGILSVLYAAGLMIIGLKFGFLIGLFTGLFSIIPYAGFSIGIISALVVSLAHYDGIGMLIGIVTVFSFIQLLESFVITPRLVGNKVGLSPLATLLALIVGGNLAGIVGMLLAIPSAAILKNIYGDLKKRYADSELFSGSA